MSAWCSNPNLPRTALLFLLFRQELVGTDVKVTNIQPGLVVSEMLESVAEDLVKQMNVPAGMLENKRDKILTAEDIGQVVWETVSRPGRCYQTEVMVLDMFFKDAEVRAAMMGESS